MARHALGSANQVESILQLGRIVGRIDTQAPAEGPLVVVLARMVPDRSLIGVDTFVRTGAGPFAFAVTPGRYHLGAYEDRKSRIRGTRASGARRDGVGSGR